MQFEITLYIQIIITFTIIKYRKSCILTELNSGHAYRELMEEVPFPIDLQSYLFNN